MQTSARDIASMLADQADAVARHLLGSAGKREGHELRFGSVNGEAGASLGVCVSGSKSGVWKDFSDDARGGDLLDLWQASRHLSLADAITEAKGYLGIRDVPLHVGRTAPAPKAIARPDRLQALTFAGRKYLNEQRLVSDAAIAAYCIAQRGDGEIAFPFKLPDGTLVNTKFRGFPKDSVSTVKDGAKVLFGWQAIPQTARTVVLCEGEYKAMVWFDYGFPALSVPFGGGGGSKQDWIEIEYDRLANFDMVILALDEDEPGRQATDLILRRLGPERCAIFRHPKIEGGAKDIQVCRRANVSRDTVAAAMAKAKPRDPEELHAAGDYTDKLVALFEDRGPEPGLRTPWGKVGDELVFRDGEVTIIMGINGHGKSQAVGFMTCHALDVNYRVCVASLEFKVHVWLQRLIKQLVARPDPTPRRVSQIAGWLSTRLWAFDAQGTADWRRMIEVFRYARRRYDVHLFVVDNLTGLGIGEEDYQGQKEVTQALANFARDEECHVWLVHHSRKLQNEYEQPGKMDVKGGGAIMDIASTGLVVWRNKRKEEKLAAAAAISAPLDPDVADRPDVRIACFKQRNYAGQGSGEPQIALWWSPGCFHYLARKDHQPRPFRMRGLEDAA